ncbi:LysM peptidoglycan-binding domain-containing protein [Priestia megaterium]|uniref:LysM peptidoglycan-binding domain-containing protein n=1 Tax=Priestia megaterium TaxID=1404 RepID=UPI000BFC300D|nr:LysM peptidoglycan-binding domain-containing protein [Priestia megaterium]PGQ88292.1 hypothetical protein COA18_05020 [Priestia megaterium]
MITYVVQPGDMIGVLAVKYKTTIRTIMSDNSFIQANQKLKPGWKLKIYTPEENAIRYSETAYAQIEKAHALKDTLETSKHMLYDPKEPVYYKGRQVLEGQIAFVQTLKPTPLIEIQANGYEKTVRTLPAGEILRVYEMTSYNGGMYLVNSYQWVTANPEVVLYDDIPQYNIDGKIDLRAQPNKANTFGIAAANPNTYSRVGAGTNSNLPSYTIKPQSMIGAGTAKTHILPDGISSIPHYERPGYRRPVLQMRNAAGETSTIELRVLGFQASYSNSIQPAQTNDGWMINIRGSGLPSLSISGFLMETKAANEFNDFMVRYHKYLKSSKSGDYYSMGVSTLFYKKTEYRGIVTGFSFSDREEETLHRKYSLQMLVLKEKDMNRADISKVPQIVSRSGLSEENFRTNIASMLANPITGQFADDF